MKIKRKLKEKLPPSIFHILSGIYKQRTLFHYWLPYVFCNGEALNPIRLDLEITFRCNQKCVMCPLANASSHEDYKLFTRPQKASELSTEEIYSLVDEAKSMDIKTFSITGGEPFLRKDTIEIIHYIKQQGLTCFTLSNGTMITKDLARSIVDSKLDRLTFSLDGPREVHDKIRQRRRAYDNLMQAVHYIKEEKEKRKSEFPHLYFTTTISALNAGFLSQLMDIAVAQGVSINFGYLFYTTNEMRENTDKIFKMDDAKAEDQNIENYLKAVNVEELKKEIEKVKEKEALFGVKSNIQPPLKGDEIRRRFYDDDFAYVNKCFYPWFAVRVNPFGEVYPCSMSVLMGNIRNDSLKKIWNNENYKNFRKHLKRNKLFPKCAKCCVLNNKLWSYLPSFS